MATRAGTQLFLIALALLLWSALGRADLLLLLAAYLVALVLWELPLTGRLLRPASHAGLALILCLPGLGFAYRERARLVPRETLFGLAEHVQDRLRLTDLPAIAPPLLSVDRPQRFFIHTGSAASAVALTLGQSLPPLPAAAVGAGLFRVDYDPRVHGVPRAVDGALDVTLSVDDRRITRQLHLVTSLPHPRWFCESPDGATAAVVSE
ncbi:MAG: hypothetical protein ABW321_29700, partial [Polyangiales bacterium]